MTREEIREGITLELMGLDAYERTLGRADAILNYLHSQGVVIKVERELPPLPRECICETHPELAEIGEVGDGLYHACEDYRDQMLKAGYVAVEPLIKEE